MKILVAYCTKTGSTEEVAKKIGEILADSSQIIDVMPISQIVDLSSYDVLILGAPINGMKVVPEFRNFIETKISGCRKETHLFILSYVYPLGRKTLKEAFRINILEGQ